MSKVSFKISSRTAALIGRENVSKADGALIELVKNTYDADASLCFVFMNEKNDEVIVYDNGEGMSEKVISDSWMTIGTKNKQYEYCSKKGRMKAGAKGIGRFALDRLGRQCDMYTKVKTSKDVLHWAVNWDDFDTGDRLLSDVEADLLTIDVDLSDCLPSRLREGIESMAAQKEIALNDLWANGTILRITKLRDEWSKADTEALRHSLAMLMPPEDQGMYSICYMTNDREGFDAVINEASRDYDYQIKAHFDGKGFDIALFRNEFDVELMPNDLFESDFFTKAPYRKEDFAGGIIHLNRSIAEILGTSSEDMLAKASELGPFDFNFLFMKRTKGGKDEVYPFVRAASSKRSVWLDLHGGVKIYRDMFWVRPYGDKDTPQYDWLNLESRHSKNPAAASRSGWTLRNVQCQGTVFISRVSNSKIEDQSNREGIVNNEYFSILKNMLLGLISIIEKDRSSIFKELKRQGQSRDDLSESILKGKKVVEKVIGKIGDTPVTALSGDDVLALAKAVESFDRQTDELMGEIKLLRSLATNGLISSSIAHDLKSKNATLVSRATIIERALDAERYDVVKNGLQGIAEQDRFLKAWISTLVDQLKQNRRRRIRTNLFLLINDAVCSLQPVLEQKMISIEVEGDSKAKPLVFEADINSIIYNLIINSVEAFSRDHVQDRRITISVFDRDNHVVVGYRDSGVGLGSEYRDPHEILGFGITSKRDVSGNPTGTGLGMYIVDSTLREYGAMLRFLQYRGAFQIEICIPV